MCREGDRRQLSVTRFEDLTYDLGNLLPADEDERDLRSYSTARLLSPDADLLAVAREGIAEVAQGAPEGSGASAVADLRARVWGRSTATVPPVPAGTAFGLHALGFLRPEAGAQAQVHTIGPWTRVATDRGFVLTR